MGVGPPTQGLEPGVGVQPGETPPVGEDFHVYPFPATTEFPGKGVWPYARFIRKPSTAQKPASFLMIDASVVPDTTRATVRSRVAAVVAERRLHLSRRAVIAAVSGKLRARLFRDPVPAKPTRIRFAGGATRVRFAGGHHRVRYATANKRVRVRS